MPAAWHIEEQRAKRVLVGILVPDAWYRTSLGWSRRYSEIMACLPPGSQPVFVPGLPFDAARNTAVAEALKGGYGYLAFLDADTLPNRPDCFNILMNTGLPLVAGIYRKRYPPFPLAAYNIATDKDGRPHVAPLPEPLPWGQIVPVDCVPTGLMLIRRDLLATAVQRFEKPFDWTMNPLHPEKWGTSEDYTFTLRCKTELGVQPYVHLGVTAQHEIQARLNGQEPGFDFDAFPASQNVQKAVYTTVGA